MKQGLTRGAYGIAKNAIRSYRQFKRMKDFAGRNPPAVCVSRQPCPDRWTVPSVVELPKAELFSRSPKEATWPGTGNRLPLLEAIPPKRSHYPNTIWPMEIELEEYRRRPEDFDTPVYEGVDWTLGDQAPSVANIANRIPPQCRTGLSPVFHLAYRPKQRARQQRPCRLVQRFVKEDQPSDRLYSHADRSRKHQCR